MLQFISPIREKAESIRTNESYLQDIMEKGAEKARKSASETMNLVREAMGLHYWLNNIHIIKKNYIQILVFENEYVLWTLFKKGLQ